MWYLDSRAFRLTFQVESALVWLKSTTALLSQELASQSVQVFTQQPLFAKVASQPIYFEVANQSSLIVRLLLLRIRVVQQGC